jgi:hypothetical protein
MHGMSEQNLDFAPICTNNIFLVRFVQNLRKTCLSDPGNKEFWAEVQKHGRGMSLISKPEAAKHGGISTIPESDAEQVSSMLPCRLCALHTDIISSSYKSDLLAFIPRHFERRIWT